MNLWVDAAVAHNGNYGGKQEATIAVHDGADAILYQYIGDYTSVEAELIAIQAGLRFAKPGDTIFSDSQLAVNFLRTRRSNYRHLQNRIDQIHVPEGIEIKWIRRDENWAGHFLDAVDGGLVDVGVLCQPPPWVGSTFAIPQENQEQISFWGRAS